MSTAAVLATSLPSDPGPGDVRNTISKEIAPVETKFTQPGPVAPNWLESLELRNLPRLPIPRLEDTLKRYLETVKPLVSAEEWEHTKGLVEEFSRTDGPSLHAELQQLARDAPTSWLEGFWDTMYLEYRDPSPINVNPAFVLNADPSLENEPSDWIQLLRAAKLLHATAWFVAVLRSGRLTPDTIGAPPNQIPLCMTQYGKLFGTCRNPVTGRDVVVTSHNSLHACVVSCNRYYAINILDESNVPIPPNTLLNQLAAIRADSLLPTPCGSPAVNIGAFTCEHRDTWSALYPMVYELNKESMDILQSSVLLLCLDGPSGSNVKLDLDALCVSALHNYGQNRYFDKSLQLIITEDGGAAINMEHSSFDGHTLIRYAGDIYSYSCETKLSAPGHPSPLHATARLPTYSESTQTLKALNVSRLSWTLTPDLRASLAAAELRFNSFALTCDTKTVNFREYGQTHITSKLQLSPDALVQMAFQIAHYKLMGRVGSTYESVQTKRFYHGRTSCLRTLTNEVHDMLKILFAPNSSATAQIEAIRRAAKAHVDQAKRCQMNEDVDRHLWGMLQLAKQRRIKFAGYNIPALYTDPAWIRMRTDHLSTSNCGNQALSLFVFGPVVNDGFGLGYIIKRDCILVAVSHFHGRAAAFATLLEQTLSQLSQLFLHQIPLRLCGSNRSKL